MKKIIFGVVTCYILLSVSILALGIGVVLFSYDLNTVSYYSDDNNYDSFECSVQSFFVRNSTILITFNHNQENYFDDFRISGKNVDLAIQNGLLDILQEGAVFTISSANAYLGDGWRYPIVELIYNGKEIIPYAQGKENFIEIRQQAESFAEKYLLISGGSFVILLALGIYFSILLFKKRKKKKLLTSPLE